MEYFQNIDWWALGQKLIIPACILVFSFFVGVVLNQLLTQKLAGRVKASESEIMEIFFRAMQGVPISLCLVIGLYWVVNTSKLPDSISQLLSYLLFTSIMFTITRVVERTVSGFINVKFSASGDAKKIFGRRRLLCANEFGCGRVRQQKFICVFGGESGSSNGG